MVARNRFLIMQRIFSSVFIYFLPIMVLINKKGKRALKNGVSKTWRPDIFLDIYKCPFSKSVAIFLHNFLKSGNRRGDPMIFISMKERERSFNVTLWNRVPVFCVTLQNPVPMFRVTLQNPVPMFRVTLQNQVPVFCVTL